MGQVAVEMKVFVEDPEYLEEVKKGVQEVVPNVQRIKEEDIGFGIKVLRVVFVMEDEGGINEIEERVNGLEHVNQCEVVEVSLV